MSERFVRLLISSHGGDPEHPVWGLNDGDNGFWLIYTTSAAAKYECGVASLGPVGLHEAEVNTIEEATEHNTPDEAWVALAKYRLTA